jgi:polar amino acid transport system substrate-binding protein
MNWPLLTRIFPGAAGRNQELVVAQMAMPHAKFAKPAKDFSFKIFLSSLRSLRPLREALLVCLTVLFVTAGCEPERGNQIVVGMETAYPPFEMTDIHGNPAGVSVDLAKALGAYLGRPVEIENIPFDGLIPALQTRKIDLIISSMTATAERARAIAFSDPYLKTGLCLLVGKTSPIQSIEEADQPGRVIAVKRGTTGHLYAMDRVKHALLRVLDK